MLPTINGSSWALPSGTDKQHFMSTEAMISKPAGAQDVISHEIGHGVVSIQQFLNIWAFGAKLNENVCDFLDAGDGTIGD
jgi:hypothetical protein